MIKTEALRQLGRNEVAQRPVVDQHDELDARARRIARRTHRHIVGNDGDFTFKVDAEFFRRHRHVVTWTEEIVRAALVDERIGPEARRHLSATRLAHELYMIHVRRAIDPMMSPRQWRSDGLRVEREDTRRTAALQLICDGLKLT